MIADALWLVVFYGLVTTASGFAVLAVTTLAFEIRDWRAVGRRDRRRTLIVEMSDGSRHRA